MVALALVALQEELEERLHKLRFEQERREYDQLTKNVTFRAQAERSVDRYSCKARACTWLPRTSSQSWCGRQGGRGGVFMGWVIRIIFDPNTRQWGAGGGFKGGDPWITFGSFFDHFGPFCLLHFQLCANCLVDLCFIFWKLNCWNK